MCLLAVFSLSRVLFSVSNQWCRLYRRPIENHCQCSAIQQIVSPHQKHLLIKMFVALLFFKWRKKNSRARVSMVHSMMSQAVAEQYCRAVITSSERTFFSHERKREMNKKNAYNIVYVWAISFKGQRLHKCVQSRKKVFWTVGVCGVCFRIEV